MTNAGDFDLGRESLKGFVGNATQAVIGFIGTLIFARLLGPASFGGFYFLMTLATFADRPMRGFVTAAKKRYSETNSPRSEIIGAALIIVAAVGIPLSTTALIGHEYLLSQTSVPNAGIVFVLLLLSIILFVFFQNLVGAAGQPARQIWLDTFRSVLTLPLQLVFVTAGFGAAGMGYGLASASLIGFGIAYYLLSSRPAFPSLETFRSLWAYARYSIPATIVGKAYNRLDVLLLGFLLTPAVVGYYEVAFKLTLPATFLYAAITTGLMPKVSNLHSRNRAVGPDITSALSYASLFAIPLFFGALALPTAIVVTLYGPEYRPAAVLLVGLALYQVLGSQSQIHQATLQGLDLPDVGLRIDAVTLALNVFVGVLLVYTYGAIGAVVATVGAESLRFCLSAYEVQKRVSDLSIIPRSLFEQVVAGIVMFLVVEQLSQVIPITSWIPLVIIVSSGALIYVSTLLTISHQHRKVVRYLFGDIVTWTTG